MNHLRSSVLATLAVLSLAGCDRQRPAHPEVRPPEVLAADAGQAGPLAAAEPFETLTEAAFTVRLPELDKIIANAMASAEQVKPALPRDAQTDLKTRLDEIAAARRIDNRAGIALAADEVYRLLVSSASPVAVPTEVSLLDYVGFRYDADLKAAPAHWDDMAAAAAFGQRRWSVIAPRVTDKILHDRMAGTLADMAAAARSRKAAPAANAVRRERALVDLLEAFFVPPA